jgi:outer membrane protein, heavy metal efflux system
MAAIIVVLLCLALATPAAAQTVAPPLTLDEAVALALRENRTLRAKQFEHQATRAGEITAGLRPNPVGTYSADHLGARSVDREYAVSVGQPIELGGKRERRLDSARAATRVSELELADTQRQIVALVKRTFTEALVARSTLALAQDNLKSLDDIERIQRFRAERGDISELELTRIQVQRFAFERDAADAQLSIQSAKIGLRALIGPDRLPSDFEIAGDVEFRDRPFDREGLYRLTLPLLVMLNLPFALVGGTLGLYLWSTNFDISAAVGFIAVFGVSVLKTLLVLPAVYALVARCSRPAGPTSPAEPAGLS